MQKRRAAFVICFGLLAGTLRGAAPGNEAALGPLGGRNLYAPQLPWFSFPAEKAAALPEGQWVARSGLYILNEFSTYPLDIGGAHILVGGKLSASDQADLAAMDYESTVWEIGADWQAYETLRFSIDWRLHFRYGGFMDPVIEMWHSILGVSNAGREFFDQNVSRWNIQSSSSFDFVGGGTVVGSGDLDLRAVWTAFERSSLAIGLGAGFKIPTGRTADGFGSGLPDAGFELLLDWRPWNRWAFYINLGLILPFDGEARMMVQGIPAVEFRVNKALSVLVQMNIQSSAISGIDVLSETFGVVPMFGLPQTDLKIGLKGRHGRFDWQFYVEEDPFTWEGPDILIYFGTGYRF